MPTQKTASRLHATGGILFILTGLAHSIGQFTSVGSDIGSVALESAMKGFVIPGTSFTYWNVMQCWGALYGGTTVLLGVLLLVALRASEPRVRAASAWVGVVAAVLQAGVSIAFRTPPPAFFMVPAAVVLALAASLPAKRPA